MVEQVSKSAVPEEIAALLGMPASERPPAGPVLPFTPLAEVGKALRRQIESMDLAAFVEQSVQRSLDRARGRV